MTGSRFVVIGGGITGLTAAYRLRERAPRGTEVILLEGSDRLGGHAHTVTDGGFVVEAGPNGFLLVMVSRGDVEENRRKAVEHGFRFPVLLQRRWEVSKEFGIFATPVGFLIGPDGVISRDVGIGMDEIMALVADPAPIGEGAV